MQPNNQKSQIQQNQNPQSKQLMSIPAGNPLGLPSESEWGQIKEICQAAVRSGMLPAAIKTAEAAAIIALKSRELGIPLMVGFANIHVVNGKPSMSAELMQAQARKNLPGLIFNITETDEKICTVQGQRPERGSLPVKVSFTIEEAKRAGLLTKDVWKNYPAAMLRSRAITAALRIICPDALMGVSYTPEELGLNYVDEAIETTSRPVENPTDAPSTEPSEEPPAAIKPNIPAEDKTTNDQERASLIREIVVLKAKLNISDNEMRQEIHREFKVESIKMLSVTQLQMLLEMIKQTDQPAPQPSTNVDPESFDNFGEIQKGIL